jgi:uncharacterized protein
MKRQVNIMGLSYSQSQIGTYVCLLAEQRGSRKLPIIVKTTDAQTIALKVENMKSPRPLSEEVTKEICEIQKLDCQEVQIYEVLEGIFYSRLILSDGFDQYEVECTAGSAIAYSQVFECPLFVEEKVFVQAGIEIDTEGNPIPEEAAAPRERVITTEDLERMLQDALDDEDYMLAAEYRDKLKERKEQND